MTENRPKVIIYMGPYLERIVLRVRDILSVDSPIDTAHAHGYVQRVICDLLDEKPLPDYYDAEAVDVLEGFLDNLLQHYQLLVDEISLIPVHACVLPFLMLEINDGCFRSSQYPRHGHVFSL